MNPTEILRRVSIKYSQCLSYSDSGRVEFDDVHQNREQIEFTSEFVRPDYLRFQWQDYGPDRGKSKQFSTLWSSGDKTLVQWDAKEAVVKEEANLRTAVAGATGCSVGAAHMVPSLLLNELRTTSKHWLQLTDLQLSREEALDSVHCYVLKGSLFKKNDHVLWISESDYSVRRVREDRSITAAESKKEHEELIANVDLMARLTELGIAPPKEMEHVDLHLVTEYIYTAVSFDTAIVRALQPETGCNT